MHYFVNPVVIVLQMKIAPVFMIWPDLLPAAGKPHIISQKAELFITYFAIVFFNKTQICVYFELPGIETCSKINDIG